MRTAPKVAVLVVIALAAPLASSPDLHAAPTQVISIGAPKMVIMPAPIIIRGSITNAKPGQKVGLQEGSGTWSKATMTTTLDAHLAYKFTVKKVYPHAHTFRTISRNGIHSRGVTVLLQNWCT